MKEPALERHRATVTETGIEPATFSLAKGLNGSEVTQRYAVSTPFLPNLALSPRFNPFRGVDFFETEQGGLVVRG